MSEEEGFEPPLPCGKSVFETDAIGLSARGDNAVSLGYDRQARGASHGRQVEYLTVALHDAPNAVYELAVQVTDRVSGRVVAATKPLIVSPTPLSR